MQELRTTIYAVSSIEEAKAWYSKVFQLEPYFDESFYVGFNVKGFELGLMPSDISTELKTENVLAYWGVESIQAEFDRLLNMGATAFEAPQMLAER